MAAARKQPKQGEGSAAVGTLCFLPTMRPVAVSRTSRGGGAWTPHEMVTSGPPCHSSQHLGCLREVQCHRNTCCTRTLPRVPQSQQPRLLCTTTDTGTPLMERGMWGTGNVKQHLLRPRAALAGAENLEGKSGKAMGDQGTLETPGEQGDAGGGVPHCPAFYRFSKHM